MRLLSIALRVLTLLACVGHRQWAAEGAKLAGLYAGNPASIMASATPLVSLCEAKALKHLRKGAFEDSDIMRSAHKWPPR